MNKPQIIFDFLCRIELIVKQKKESPFECMAKGLEISDYNDLNLLRIKLAQNVYDVAEFIEADHGMDLLDKTWIKDLISLLMADLSNAHDFYNIANKLFPSTKNFIGSQIRLWKLVNGQNEKLASESILKIKENTNLLLQDLVQNSLIDDHVKAFLIKKLRKILEALDYYQIYGNEGLIEVLEESIGHAFTNKKYEDFLKSENSKAWKEYLVIVSTTLAASDSFISITNNIRNFLP